MTNEVKQTPPNIEGGHVDKAALELGETFLVGEPLTEEEDRRILRLIDLKYVTADRHFFFPPLPSRHFGV